MILTVRTTPEADSQIRTIDAWWRNNRPAAADLFLAELGESFELLANAPQLGRLYRPSPVGQVRRLLLKGTRNHVYYVAITDEVRVLAVWHTQRGGPRSARNDQNAALRRRPQLNLSPQLNLFLTSKRP